jgi:RNA polymerase sigma factor (sigma-70 family)
MRSEAMRWAELSDAELVAECLNGSRDAFGQIVERYQTLIGSIAYCATGDVSQSEDLAQETFVSAWKQLAALREPAKLRPWLCAITRFLISKEVRRQGREPIYEAESMDSLDEWTSTEPLPLDHAISNEELSLLWRSLERIPTAYREPLVLFYRERQSIEAVAEGLGLSEDAVKQRLSRGRKFLQEQFLAFVAGALDQTRPNKTFVLGVLAALPLVGATARGATVGTVLANQGGVAAKTAGSGGFAQTISNVVLSMYSALAAALPLGGYIGYKMGGDSQRSERARRSVATFWRIMGIGMFLFFCFPPLLVILLVKMKHLSDVKAIAALGFWLNVCLPIFMFGVVPLSLVLWIIQRGRRTVPGGAITAPTSGKSRKFFAGWTVLAMTVALVYLGLSCWLYTMMSNFSSHSPKPRYLSTSELQTLVANPQVREYRFKLLQSAKGDRRLSGDLLEDGKVSFFIAPAESGTLALLADKGIGYETKLENRELSPRITEVGAWSSRLLDPFCCFIVMAGSVTLLRGSRNREFRASATIEPNNERRVDKAFAALAACGMLAMALAVGLTTDWRVRRIAAYEVANVVARHSNARFEVFEYGDGSRELWISDLRTPDFTAPANEATLRLLNRQGITYQTYVAGDVGLPGRSKAIAVMMILALSVVSGCLFWWTMKSAPLPLPASGRRKQYEIHFH